MQITIGEYTTRNGCRAIVDARDGPSFVGTVILPGGMTYVRTWWDSTGAIKFPPGKWVKNGEVYHFESGDIITRMIYFERIYTILTAIPIPFDITGPKQMKEETKPETAQNQRLIKLPNGTWLDPKTVTSISIFGPSFLDEGGVPVWYVTVYTPINDISIKCDSTEQAQRMADDLAEKVNSIK